MAKETASEKIFKKMKRTVLENGDEYIPVKSFLGVYYLRFYKAPGFKHFIVWRTNGLELDKNSVLVCKVSPDEIEDAFKKTDIKTGFILPFEEIDVMKEMAKKL